ncbi:MAG: hypothetical protein ACK5QX_06775, partial [bacterium]
MRARRDRRLRERVPLERLDAVRILPTASREDRFLLLPPKARAARCVPSGPRPTSRNGAEIHPLAIGPVRVVGFVPRSERARVVDEARAVHVDRLLRCRRVREIEDRSRIRVGECTAQTPTNRAERVHVRDVLDARGVSRAGELPVQIDERLTLRRSPILRVEISTRRHPNQDVLYRLLLQRGGAPQVARLLRRDELAVHRIGDVEVKQGHAAARVDPPLRDEVVALHRRAVAALPTVLSLDAVGDVDAPLRASRALRIGDLPPPLEVHD